MSDFILLGAHISLPFTCYVVLVPLLKLSWSLYLHLFLSSLICSTRPRVCCYAATVWLLLFCNEVRDFSQNFFGQEPFWLYTHFRHCMLILYLEVLLLLLICSYSLVDLWCFWNRHHVIHEEPCFFPYVCTHVLLASFPHINVFFKTPSVMPNSNGEGM